MCLCYFFFFKQKTAYEMRISDWSSDVCSSDLDVIDAEQQEVLLRQLAVGDLLVHFCPSTSCSGLAPSTILPAPALLILIVRTSGSTTWRLRSTCSNPRSRVAPRSEEHTSELQSLMRISYAVFCFKNKLKLSKYILMYAIDH